jgi:hypothetical protein
MTKRDNDDAGFVACTLCTKVRSDLGITCPVCRGSAKIPSSRKTETYQDARAEILGLLETLNKRYPRPLRDEIREALLVILEELYVVDGALKKTVEILLEKLEAEAE